MKKMKMALALGAAALFVGCGGGGGGGSDTTAGSDSSSSLSAGASSSAGGTVSEAEKLTLNSVDDVKGYTLQTNQSTLTIGDTALHQIITLAFACDGSFTYTIENSGNGYTVTDVGSGDEIYLDTAFDAYELNWHGTWHGGGVFDAGEDAGDLLTLENTNEIIAGHTCWMDMGDGSSGEGCPNNLYIANITQNAVCN